MKNKIIKIIGTGILVSTLAVALPAFAQQGNNIGSSTGRFPRAGARNASSTDERIANGQSRAETMIDNRVTSLNNLLTRIQGLKNVSDAQKSALTTTVQSVIANLTALKAQIASLTSTTTLKADALEITQANRVYALVIPQTNIIAAADREQTIVSMMNTIVTKLQTRISAATTTPSGVQTAMTDIATKLSDATTQAQAAINEVTTLVPDQGDKTKMAANTAALKDGRTKIRGANKDIVAARKDISTVTKALKTK